MGKKRGRAVEGQLKKINSALQRIEKEEKKIEKEEDRIKNAEKRVEKKIDEISKEEIAIEKIILKVGRFNVRKKHVLDLIGAGAGAFLGVGIGRGLIGLDGLAKNLAWGNIIGILIFIWVISALLIYKNQRAEVQAKGKAIILPRLFFIYLISILIEVISLFLFNVQYDSFATLVKIMIVGSYTAMASAITFSIIK